MVCFERDLLRLLPPVLRARDFHLYLEGGKRLVDLWLEGGKAILGHKPPNILRELKNSGERGLFSGLPHPMEKRFIKALNIFFPNRSFRIFTDETSLFKALDEAGFRDLVLRDPAFPPAPPALQDHENNSSDKEHIILWRPFLNPTEVSAEVPAEISAASISIPVLPWPLSPTVLVFDKSLEGSFRSGNSRGELIPPVLLAPATRALYDLAASLKAKTPNRGNPVFPKIDKALKKSIWRRRGIYLTVDQDFSKENYAALFSQFLEGGFLIPPSKAEPAILPGSMSSGEEVKLAALLEE